MSISNRWETLNSKREASACSAQNSGVSINWWFTITVLAICHNIFSRISIIILYEGLKEADKFGRMCIHCKFHPMLLHVSF